MKVEIGGQELALRVVAVLPRAMDGGVRFLLPREIVRGDALKDAATLTIVRTASDVDSATVAAAIRAAGLGEVSTVDESLAGQATARGGPNSGIMAVLMGLAGLSALIAIINAVVIAAAELKSEFAAARVTGLSRGQVVRMVLIESWAVTAIGLFLGCLAAAGCLLGIGAATGRITGVAVIAVPWELLGVVVLGATSGWTSLSATRVAPVSWD